MCRALPMPEEGKHRAYGLDRSQNKFCPGIWKKAPAKRRNLAEHVLQHVRNTSIVLEQPMQRGCSCL